MRIRTIERFTAQIAKTDGGPRENVGYFADADSAKLWGQALLYTREAVSARVVRIRWAERPGVNGAQWLDDIGEIADRDQ